MNVSQVPLSVANIDLTETEKGELENLNCSFLTVYQDQSDWAARDAILRSYIALKLRIVGRGLRFGIINNRIFINSGEVLIPYQLSKTIIVFRANNEVSEFVNAHVIPDGAIITDKFIIDLTGFEGQVIDLEKDLFELDLSRCKSVRVGHIRDMATQLERMAQSANLSDATYLLRTLVAQTSLLSFKEYLSAKNLQVEVRRLRSQLLNFLNSPLSYRVPFLIRIIVRNISSVVAKPKLIDRLWNDTIDLSEVHLRGSQIVNEIRRSTHHAVGKRTLLIVKSYLDYLETGGDEGLIQLGYPEPGPIDKKARQMEEPKKIVARVLSDLRELLGSSDVLKRISDWQNRYTTTLSLCDSDESIEAEVELAITDGIKDNNRWMFYHHLRIIRNRVSQFSQLPSAAATEQTLKQLLELEPDTPEFDATKAETDLRKCINDFVNEAQATYQGDLFRSLIELTDAFQDKAYIKSFIKGCKLRKQLWVRLIEGDFPEQRLLSYELDCLLEEISFIALRHIAGSYDEKGVNLPQCLEIISLCALNLTHDGLHSRQLLDLVGMLADKSHTYAELTNVLQQIRKNYQHILRQLIVPFELMKSRLEVDAGELHIALANMQRFLHDLNSMAAFADTALTHIEQKVSNTDDKVDYGAGVADDESEKDLIVHLSHRDEIQELVRSNDPKRNLRALYGGKGSGLVYISYLNIPTPDGFILPTSLANKRLHGTDDSWLDEVIRQHVSLLEDDIKKCPDSERQFGNPDQPLLLAVRGGSVFSMPGILSTVLFVGMNDTIAKAMAKSDPWNAYDSYRRFLASYALSVWDVDVEKYDLIEKAKTSMGVEYKESLTWETMREVVEETKQIIHSEGHGEALEKALNDPMFQLFSAIRAVMDSWNLPTCKWYRGLKYICDKWNTAIVIQEMSLGNRKNEKIQIGMDETKVSLTGVIPRTQVTELGVRECAGEFKFSACGEDLVGGLTTSNSFLPFKELKSYMPMLDRRIRHKVSRLRSFMGTDQEIEFTVDRGVLSVLQSRAAEIGANKNIHAFLDPGEAITRGLGIRGSAFRGLVAFDESDFKKLSAEDISNRDDVDGILLVLENPTPADIPLVLMAQGLLASSGGSTSHAAVSIHSIDQKDYCAVMSTNNLRVDLEQREAVVLDSDRNKMASFKTGDIVSVHGGTGKVYLGSMPIKSN